MIDYTPNDFLFFVRDNQKISAIKALRAMIGVGLKEAKDMVETLPQFRAVGVPLADTLNPNDARYVVVQTDSDSYNGSAVIDTFHGSPNSFNEAIDYARSRIECDRDVTVAKVIATTKRTLQVL